MLIVDDEPNLVEGLADYLAEMLPPDTDILKAYSGQTAHSLLMRFPIDLIISDIQMPGMLGLELLTHIERNCPTCCVIFLTGYDTFEWIQEALRHPCCVDYILKTQGDAVIGAAVKRQLSLVDKGRDLETLKKQLSAQYRAIRPLIRQQAITDWLQGKADSPLLDNDDTDAPAIVICLYSRRDIGQLAQLFPPMLESLLRDEFTGATIETALIGWEEYVCLLRFPTTAPMVTHLHTKLSKIQTRLRDLGEVVSCAYHGAPVIPCQAKQALQHLRKLLSAAIEAGEEVIIDSNRYHEPAHNNETDLLQWIKQYIAQNIADPNLSLAIIAEKTYYAPAYLSRMFKQHQGENLLSYISGVRVHMACKYLREGKQSVKEVCKAVGFESPSYFSAFFRRNVGVTPVEYMRDKSRK